MTAMKATRAHILGLLCLGMWLGLLAAGLWPFRFSAANQVSWIPGRNGVHFSEFGQMYTEIPLGTRGTPFPNASFTLELWLRGNAGNDHLTPVFSMESPAHRDNLIVAQSLDDLLVQGQFHDRKGNGVHSANLWLDHVFDRSQPRFLTVVSGPQDTTTYLDGVPYKTRAGLTFMASESQGRMLLGHAAQGNQTWNGDIYGLGLHARPLTPEEVAQHYQAWREGKWNELKDPFAKGGVYIFEANRGRRVPDVTGFLPDFVIPERFHPFRLSALKFPSQFGKPELEDTVVNILGLIPFGFLVAVYCRKRNCNRRKSWWVALIAGAGTSLLIELLQVYLPVRDSSAMDLINNILGTAVGATAGVVYWRIGALTAGSRQ